MSRFTLISPNSATGQVKNLLDSVQAKLGMVPNMMRAMANGAAALEGYLQLNNSLSHGTLSSKNREQLALAISQANDCHYCLAAHSAIGKMVGLSADQISDSRLGKSVDPKTEVLIQFATKLVQTRGRVQESDIEDVRNAGFDDGVITEVVAHVALNVFTNYFNNLVETDIDFPAVPALLSEPAMAD